ncbi:MFS transporter [Burkholderia arboris]|uniref:MFS transporter n=1 Tax=Burkholderia arboris TaxID=488730 RepID=UPI001CF4BC19|nr:MFS transporter [Burkholderia arboris]MCA8052359.1 MFS transporter [Burkholderia arboris]
MSDAHMNMSASSDAAAPGHRRAIFASAIGSMMEWYDFVTYSYLATYISHAFFPSGNETTALLATFATFGVGFLARPLGGFVFGVLGDRSGRKVAMLITMFMMAIATGLIGILPGYAEIGIIAPILLVLARIAQGMSAGGEGTTAISYVVEWAPRGKRGLFGALMGAGSGFGLLLGSATVTILNSFLSHNDIQEWGWRVPFLLGVLIGPIGLWIRRSIDESPAYLRAKKSIPAKSSTPTIAPWRLGGRAFMFLLFWSVAYYVFLSFMPHFATHYLKVSGFTAFWVNTLSVFVYVCLVPVFGYLSDRVGRKPVLLASCLGFAATCYPLFKILLSGVGLGTYVAILLFFATLLAMYSGPGAATCAEIFPTRIRSKWLSIGYGSSVAIFGGFTPFIATWLIEKMGTPLAPTWYVTVTAIIGAGVVLWLRETAHSELQ